MNHNKINPPMNDMPGWHGFASSDAAAPVTLLLHGFMGRAQDWRPVVEEISPTCRCLCPDLPGHGALRHDPGVTAMDMTQTADFLVKGLDAQGISRCALAGYSMGGRLALYLAVHYPERFTCLILESASPGLADARERKQRLAQDEALADRLAGMTEGSAGFEAFLRDWYRQEIFHTLKERHKLFETLVHHRLANHPPALAEALRGLGPGVQPSLWRALDTLALPTLVLAGGEDLKFCGIAEAMMTRLPDGMLEIVAGCSHVPHLEEPRKCALLFKRFIHDRMP